METRYMAYILEVKDKITRLIKYGVKLSSISL